VPFIIKDPVIFTEPVNSCVLDNSLPNIVDPVMYSVLEVITCATIVCAVKVPLTKKSSAEDAVKELIAQLEVPYKDPVNPPNEIVEPVI